jgi:hypothetical protein
VKSTRGICRPDLGTRGASGPGSRSTCFCVEGASEGRCQSLTAQVFHTGLEPVTAAQAFA